MGVRALNSVRGRRSPSSFTRVRPPTTPSPGRAAVRPALLALLGSLALLAPAGILGQVATSQEALPDPAIRASEMLLFPARLHVEAVPLGEALQILESTAGVSVAFSPSLVPVDRLVTCRCQNVTVQTAMQEILGGTGLEAVVLAEHLIIRERREPIREMIPPGLAAHSGDAAAAPLPSLRRAPVATVARRGSVSGRVLDAESGEPLAAVQVHIPALGVGVLSEVDGSYHLPGLPPGDYTVRAQMLGSRLANQRVTVSAGTRSDLEFRMARDALALDELVVTGTAGGTRSRAIGNVVGRVAVSQITEISPITSMQDLLGARETGLSFHRSSGNLGTGSQLRIRGVSSVTMQNQPLIYVDGVRVDNEGARGPNIRDGRQVSMLDDFSPEEIESIEIIKGPAAATLYGTEASAGVIQIITKRGQTGAPRFDLAVRQGATWLQDISRMVGESFARQPDGSVVSFNIYEEERAAGRNHFQTGHLQSYTVSMRGGSDHVRYFLSADVDDHEGIVAYNWQRQGNLRSNITVIPSDRLALDMSLGYIRGRTSFMQQLTAWGMWEQFQWATPAGRDGTLRGFLRARPEEIANVEAIRDMNRFTGSVTVTHTPSDWLTHRLIVGSDVVNEENYVLFPRNPQGALHDFGGLSLGDLRMERPNRRYHTLDYAGSVWYGASPELRFSSSIGLQYYSRTEREIGGRGRVFPAPQIRTLSGAAATSAYETFLANKSVGIYVQQEVSLRDRIFLTAAVRGDDNSAFGTSYDAAVYPKFSGTWVLSEEDFWVVRGLERWVDSFRFRSAWGKAGRQPETFAAVTLFTPEPGAGGQPSVSPEVLGNPDLGPEVSTELELGFDASLLGDRVTTEFTYFTQRVNEALISIPIPPTQGFPGSQTVNLGQLSNRGWELQLHGEFLEGPHLRWAVGTGITSNENRVDDLGGRPPTQELREGRPYPFQMERVILTAELNEAGTIIPESLTCDMGGGPDGLEPSGIPGPCSGPGGAPLVRMGNGLAIPKYEANLNSTLTLFGNLRLFAMVEWRGEHWRALTDASCRHTCFQTSEAAVRRHLPFAVAAIDGNVAGTRHVGSFNAAFAKLREVSATYAFPPGWSGRMGASRASISVAGRNLWTIWTAQDQISGVPVTDPEARNATSFTTSNSNVPPLTSLVVTARVSF